MPDRKLFTAAGIVALSVMLCGFSCSTSTQRLATASDAIAHSLVNAQTAASQAVQAGVMTNDEYVKFNQFLTTAATTGLELDTAIRQNQSSTSVQESLGHFLDAFNALQKTGLVGIKDPKTQLAVSTIITSAETSIAVIQASIGSTKTPTGAKQ